MTKRGGRKPRNLGKLFEREIAKTLSLYGCSYNFPDSKREHVKPADVMACVRSVCLLVECKSTRGGRIAYSDRFKGQVERLLHWEQEGGAVGYVALNFRTTRNVGAAYFVPVRHFKKEMDSLGLSSLGSWTAAGVFHHYALVRERGTSTWLVDKGHQCSGFFFGEVREAQT
jgi:Holliday junction resolvase